MAEDNMGKSMRKRECEWVRARLPLWAAQGVRDEQASGGEGSDLSAKESGVITRHLAQCTACRQHRLDLEQALGAIAVAAAHLPLFQDSPSLWPELERRIANHPHASESGRWPHVTDRDVRSHGPWSELDDDRPISQAWTRDTISELLAGRRRHGTKSRWKADLIFGLSIAATILMGLTLLQFLQRRWDDAEATIAANRMSLGEIVVPLPISEEPVLETADRDKNVVTPIQLPEAEPPRPAESQAVAVETAPPLKSPPPTRFGFDLDHGTPMPPDSREAKPVY
jgi:hypothetical protein